MHQDHFDDDFLIRLLRDPSELQKSGRENHLDACENCKGRLELYQRVQLFIRGETNFEVPTTWVERMVHLFDAESLRKALAPSESFAWLAFDSLLAGAEGIRSTAEPQRHLIWESREFRVELMVESADQYVSELIGQLTEKRPDENVQIAGTIVEAKVGADVFTSEVNSIGEFMIPVGRITRGDPIEVRFQFAGRPALTLLIPS